MSVGVLQAPWAIDFSVLEVPFGYLLVFSFFYFFARHIYINVFISSQLNNWLFWNLVLVIALLKFCYELHFSFLESLVIF